MNLLQSSIALSAPSRRAKIAVSRHEGCATNLAQYLPLRRDSIGCDQRTCPLRRQLSIRRGEDLGRTRTDEWRTRQGQKKRARIASTERPLERSMYNIDDCLRTLSATQSPCSTRKQTSKGRKRGNSSIDSASNDGIISCSCCSSHAYNLGPTKSCTPE